MTHDQLAAPRSRTLVLLLSGFFLVFLAVQILNGRFWMHDFQVYWGASRAFWTGESVYGVPFGLSTGLYKYSPFFLIVMGPLAALPLFAAKTVHFFVTAGVAVAALVGLARLGRQVVLGEAEGGAPRRVLALGFLIVAVHLYRELHLGNVNMILLGLLGATAALLLARRDLPAGVLLGGVLLIKPPFLILVPLLLLRRRIRAVAGAFLAVGTGVLLPALRVGWARNVELHREWVDTMTAHGSSTLDGPNTVYSMTHRIVGGILGDPGDLFVPVVLGITAVLFLGLMLAHARSRPPGNDAVAGIDLYLEFFLLVAAVPLITLTDTEHFLLSWSLILLVLTALADGRGNRVLPAVAVMLFVGYGGNWHDLVGHTISRAWDRSGILGLSHLGILVLAIVLVHRVRAVRIRAGS